MVAVYQAALDLLRRLHVHPEVAAQGEKGSGPRLCAGSRTRVAGVLWVMVGTVG